MLFRFCSYGFLKNQRYFEPFLMLVFLDRGLSFFAIGVLIACRDLTVNIFEIPSGAIADSFGRRRCMMVSFIAYIASFLVLGLANQLTLLGLGMLLYGIGDTFRTGTHKAMIFEWLRIHNRSDERTKIYGLTRSWSQIGSGVSGIIAAIFVLISDRYDYIFFFAILPYAINLVNFSGYPAALDGDHAKATTIGESARRLKQSITESISRPAIGRLIAESMGWEGFFGAIKDYLQPILQSLAVVTIATWISAQPAAGQGSGLSDIQVTALLVGPVYALLFFASAWASRNAYRICEFFNGETPAAKWLWLVNACLFGVIGIAAWLGQSSVLVFAFVSLHILKNAWRPILISRFDLVTDPHQGATIMSLESQAQRSATFLMAPAIGWIIDYVSITQTETRFWPIGLIGSVIAMIMFWTRPRVT